MKKKVLKIIISLTLVFIMVFSSTVFVVINALNKRVRDHIQNLNYLETTQAFLNPDQGFYRTACIKITPELVEDKTYIIKNDFQLYHLRFDISAFSKTVNEVSDLELTEIALKGIEDTINTFCDAGKNVIVRFSYDKDFSGLKDQEPSEDMILKHISQICSVLNKFPITVTAIEAGMVGPWGEMHSSILANSSTISKIIGKFLNNTSKIPILVRTPKMIYDYLEISIQDIDNYNIQSNSKAYRLGLFNDGFLASESDLGTYTDREKDIEFISKQTEHLPFGGEVTGTTSNLHDIDKCLPEMFKLNLSYLNYEWNDEIVTTKWQNQLYDENAGNDSLYYGKTAYNYIKDHMGYRFVLKNSTFTYSGLYDNLKISLKIDNVGFGNLNKSKNMIAYFVREDGVVEKVALVGSFNGENEITFNINISTLTGNYAVFLAINSLQNGNFCYPIRFANDLWNNSLKANHIGNIIIK